MTLDTGGIDLGVVWEALAAPFPPDLIQHRPGRGGKSFGYITARDVMNRLDSVIGPDHWNFRWELVDGADQAVKGSLDLNMNGSYVYRQDVGYPNADGDDEPLKGAVSDALKRCAVHYGIGRHLYEDAPAQAARPARPAGLSNRDIEAEFPGARVESVAEAAPDRMAKYNAGYLMATALHIVPDQLRFRPSAQEVEDAITKLGAQIKEATAKATVVTQEVLV